MSNETEFCANTYWVSSPDKSEIEIRPSGTENKIVVNSSGITLTGYEVPSDPAAPRYVIESASLPSDGEGYTDNILLGPNTGHYLVTFTVFANVADVANRLKIMKYIYGLFEGAVNYTDLTSESYGTSTDCDAYPSMVNTGGNLYCNIGWACGSSAPNNWKFVTQIQTLQE